MTQPVHVTQPSLAPLPEYIQYLQDIWDCKILTNNGTMVRRLEQELAQKFGLTHCAIVLNGTIALQMAIKALALRGEIITTPFTWVATASAIKWEGCTPIFCDINAETLNIDADKIEALITDKTVAIMPVHVFGTACDIDKIQAIAKKHKIKVIYDAAHAMGTQYGGRSIMEYGDISATSLHATKLLNTGEGGACMTTSDALDKKLRRIRFFGHDDDRNVVEDGFNGKMTEIHAALGLANMKYTDAVLKKRKDGYMQYKNALEGVSSLRFQRIEHGATNYSYFPVVFESESTLLHVAEKMADENIFPRRYFYPSINTYTHIVRYQPAPVSEDISKRILCLPLYTDLESAIIEKIAKLIKNNV